MSNPVRSHCARRKMMAGTWIVLSLMAQTVAGRAEPPSANRPEVQPAKSLESIQQQLAGLDKRVRPAIVRVEGARTPRGQAASTGVIVTDQGHIVVSAKLANQSLTIWLPDGRKVSAKTLGWSHEKGIALAKLEGAGPWPHVQSGPPPAVHAGQAIATFAYSAPDRGHLIGPLMELEWIDRSLPGFWFMRPDGTKLERKVGGVAFDLDGRFVGIECQTFLSHGTVFVDAALVHSSWKELVEGKNLDEILVEKSAAPTPQSSPRQTGRDIDAERRAIAATVHIRRKVDQKGLSGVIVSADGWIASVAHHFIMPGGKVIVSLSDGRDLQGEVVGVSFPADISLIRLKLEKDVSLPFVAMGDSTRLKPGEECLAIGYGPVANEIRTPHVRHAKVVEATSRTGSHELPLDPAAQFQGGDCGGGIFDAAGQLVAIANPHAGLPWPHENPRVELLRRQWEQLRLPFAQASQPEFADVEKRLVALATASRASVVEIVEAQQPIALGTIVDGDGSVVTKASLLPDSTRVRGRLADGTLVSLAPLKVDRDCDLAVLKIEEKKPLTPIPWSAEANGMLATVPGSKTVLGTMGPNSVTFPAKRGHLRASFKETKEGLIVDAVMKDETFTFDDSTPFGPQPLQKGDRILSVEGKAIGKLAEMTALFDVRKKPVAVTGDRIRVVVQRDSAQREFSLILGPSAWPIRSGQSARSSNFSQVRSLCTTTPVDLLGGPVIDSGGKAVGIAIAARQTGLILVLPAETVRRLLAK